MLLLHVRTHTKREEKHCFEKVLWLVSSDSSSRPQPAVVLFTIVCPSTRLQGSKQTKTRIELRPKVSIHSFPFDQVPPPRVHSFIDSSGPHPCKVKEKFKHPRTVTHALVRACARARAIRADSCVFGFLGLFLYTLSRLSLDRFFLDTRHALL